MKSKPLDDLINEELKSDTDITEWLRIAIEDYSKDGDIAAFTTSLEKAIRAKDNISSIAKKSGVSRSNLYNLFKGESHPQLDTFIKILKALGYELDIKSA